MGKEINGDPYPLPKNSAALFASFHNPQIDPDSFEIFTTQANEPLAIKIGDFFNKKVYRASSNFGDTEIDPYIEPNVSDKMTFLISSMYPEPNNSVMDTQLVLSALRDSGASRRIALIPYLAYARSDRRGGPGTTAGAKVVLRGLQVNGATEMDILDPHDERILEIPEIRTRSLWASKAEIPVIAEQEFPEGTIDEDTTSSPDIGGSRRARFWAQRLGISKLVFMHKVRDDKSHDKTETLGMVGEPGTGKKVLIDDLVSTGGTIYDGSYLLKRAADERLIYDTADTLKQHGVNKVIAAIAHGLFVPDPKHSNLTLPERMVRDGINCPIDKLIFTDSIIPAPIFEEEQWLKERTTIVSSAPIFAVAMMCYLARGDFDRRLKFKD